MAIAADIFDRLKQDHDRHRELIAGIEQAATGSRQQATLFEQFTIDVKSHAAAEEQALYSTMLRKPETTDETRHSVAEHHRIEVALNDLAATNAGTPQWMEKFGQLKHAYLHHIGEEEDEHFPDFARYLTAADEEYMRSVFDTRKKAEMRHAEVTPEKKEEAKE